MPSLISQVPVTKDFNQENFTEGGLYIWSDNNLLSDIRLWRKNKKCHFLIYKVYIENNFLMYLKADEDFPKICYSLFHNIIIPLSKL